MTVQTVISAKHVHVGNFAKAFINKQAEKLEDYHAHIDYAEVRLWKQSGQFVGLLRAPIAHQETIHVQSSSHSLGNVLQALFERGKRLAKRRREKQTQH